MNLLAISYNLPPNLYPQAIQVGRLLYNLSANIGAVCGTVEQLEDGLNCYPDFDDKLAFRLTVQHTPILSGWMHLLAIHGLPFYGRCPDEFKGWMRKAEQTVLDFLPHSTSYPDAIISFGQPMTDHLLGLRLKKKLNLPWIAHFSDPWADNLFNQRFFLSNILNRRMEKKVIREADQIIFTSEETLDLVMSKYPSNWHKKARVLPHCFESHFYPSVQTKSSIDPYVIRYLGNFYNTRTPEPLFEGLAQILKQAPDALVNVQVELVGNTPNRMLNSSAYKSLPEGLIKIVETQDYLKSLELMKSADLLLVIDAPIELSVFLPSKLIDYLGAGIPILGIVPPGTSSKLISRLGGKVANPDNISDVASALLYSIDLCKIRRNQELDIPWGDENIRDEYQSERIATIFYKLINEVIN